MATQTNKSTSEKEQSPLSTENKEQAESAEKKKQRTKVDTDEVARGTGDSERKETYDLVQAKKGASGNSEHSVKIDLTKQDGRKEKPLQNGTLHKPEVANKSQKDESQLNNNSNKRLRFGPSQRNKSGARAKNGSYYNYYKRRYNGIHGDDRLPIVRDAVKLQGKDLSLLDIGCNDGTVTIEMASLDRCVQAVGVDIDPNLVGAARKKLREYIEKEASKSEAELAKPNIQGPIPKPNDAFPLPLRRSLHLMKEAKKGEDKLPTHTGKEANGSDIESENLDRKDSFSESNDSFSQFLHRALRMKKENKDKEEELARTVPKFPHNVTFRREDFAQKDPTRTSKEVEKYDVVLCLSVTKWVHFAGGDEALKRLFRRLHACLRPGGVLILEPQPQKSYKSAIRKGLGKKDCKGERKLKPPKFPEYLTKTVGFSRMRMLRDVRHRGQAFNRPIMAFYKKHDKSAGRFGLALANHADAFLGVLPSDDEGDEQQEPEQLSATDEEGGPEEQQDGEQNDIVDEIINGDAAQEVKEDGKDEDGNEDAQPNNKDEVSNGQEEQEIDRKEPEAEPQMASAEPRKTECDASAPENAAASEDIKALEAQGNDESQLANRVKASSPERSDNQAAFLSSSGSKRRSMDADVDGANAQSPKRSKYEKEEKTNEPKPSSEGSSD